MTLYKYAVLKRTKIQLFRVFFFIILVLHTNWKPTSETLTQASFPFFDRMIIKIIAAGSILDELATGMCACDCLSLEKSCGFWISKI